MVALGTQSKGVFIGHACLVLGTLISLGCTESSPQADFDGQPFVRVLYQGQPLSDIQVRLHESLEGPVLAQSISGQDGNAYFAKVPSPEPAKYFVTVESIGDGGWLLDPKASQRLSKNVSLEPLESSADQQLEIPAGAIKQLSSFK